MWTMVFFSSYGFFVIRHILLFDKSCYTSLMLVCTIFAFIHQINMNNIFCFSVSQTFQLNNVYVYFQVNMMMKKNFIVQKLVVLLKIRWTVPCFSFVTTEWQCTSRVNLASCLMHTWVSATGKRKYPADLRLEEVQPSTIYSLLLTCGVHGKQCENCLCVHSK